MSLDGNEIINLPLLPDVQQQSDTRRMTLNRVGVTGVKFPLVVKCKDGRDVTVHAVFDMYASLFHTLRGVNMSRFTEVLMNWKDRALSPDTFKDMLTELKYKIQAQDVYVSAEFNYFISKLAPVSKKESLLSYNCKFIGRIFKKKYSLIMQVEVPVTSVCPCSKEMSKYGAHNQRGIITLQIKGPHLPWIEDIVKIIETTGSCEIYTLLKRPDEKFVTEKGYENPKFCEDIARDLALMIQQVPTVTWFRIRVLNFESIHDHQACAYIGRNKKGGKWYKNDRGFY